MIPRNHLTRAERLARWNAEAVRGQRFRPERISGRSCARNDWLRRVFDPKCELASTVRLVGAALVTNGDNNGQDIFPGVRLLSGQCGLSSRATCNALQALVTCGYVIREWRRCNAEGVGIAGGGFRYILALPVLTPSQQGNGQVLTDDLQHSSVRTDDAHRVHGE